MGPAGSRDRCRSRPADRETRNPARIGYGSAHPGIPAVLRRRIGGAGEGRTCSSHRRVNRISARIGESAIDSGNRVSVSDILR